MHELGAFPGEPPSGAGSHAVRALAVALLNPSVIVLSSELTGLSDLLLDSIRHDLSLSWFSAAVKDLKLEFSRLNRTDTARGAALLMRNQLLLM